MNTFLPEGIGFLGFDVMVMVFPNEVSNSFPVYLISLDHLSSLDL